MRKSEKVTILLIAGFLLATALNIIEAAKAHEPSSHQPTWQPPKIEQCDLPLWDRIRRLCP